MPVDASELDGLELDYPVVVKPAVKERFVRVTRAKAWRADSPAELRELVAKAQSIVPAGETMVQEHIPGGGESQYAYCAFFKDGEAVHVAVRAPAPAAPWEFGRASTFVETVEAFPELEEHSLNFLRKIDYYGLAEVEYKYDARDGRFKLLDVNARTWGYHTLGSAAGVDFSAGLYEDQVGHDVERRQARPGVSWVRLMTDLPTGVSDLFARGSAPAPTCARSARPTPRPSGTAATCARGSPSSPSSPTWPSSAASDAAAGAAARAAPGRPQVRRARARSVRSCS